MVQTIIFRFYKLIFGDVFPSKNSLTENLGNLRGFGYWATDVQSLSESPKIVGRFCFFDDWNTIPTIFQMSWWQNSPTKSAWNHPKIARSLPLIVIGHDTDGGKGPYQRCGCCRNCWCFRFPKNLWKTTATTTQTEVVYTLLTTGRRPTLYLYLGFCENRTLKTPAPATRRGKGRVLYGSVWRCQKELQKSFMRVLQIRWWFVVAGWKIKIDPLL